MSLSFKAHVQMLLKEHRGERVFQFEYLGKHYWLKQPEQLRDMVIIKTASKATF